MWRTHVTSNGTAGEPRCGDLLAFDALAEADADLLRQSLASTIQHMCTGPLR